MISASALLSLIVLSLAVSLDAATDHWAMEQCTALSSGAELEHMAQHGPTCRVRWKASGFDQSRQTP